MIARSAMVRIASVAVLSVAALAGGVGLSTADAASTWLPITETGLPGHLVLKSKGNLASLLSLSPGEVKRWQLNASLVDPNSPLTLQVWREGVLTARPDGLQLQIRACNSEWVNFPAAPSCPSASTILGSMAASDTRLGALGASGSAMPVIPAGTIANNHDKFLLISVWLPDTPTVRADESLMGLSAGLGLGLTVNGDGTVPAGGPPETTLAETGVQVVSGMLAATGAIGIGFVLLMFRRLTRPEARQ